MSLDRFGRNIHYLRVSLTDKCNLRCVYCMAEDMVFRPNPELMQDDEMITLIHLFTELGFDKFRLTGGEPTIRPNVVEIVREIAKTPGVNSLSMTTNGVLLGKLAQPLADATHEIGICLAVLADDEEGRRHIFLLQNIEDLRCPSRIWPIVKRQCQQSRSIARSLDDVRRRQGSNLFRLDESTCLINFEIARTFLRARHHL